MDEARDLVGKVKILNLETDKNKFDWTRLLIVKEISISKWLPSCGSWTGVTPQDRKRVQLDLQQALVRAPIEVKGEHVRGTLETAPDKRPWNEAQSIFLRTMRENAGLTKEQFDMRWVSTGIRVSVNGAPPGCLAVLLPVASITIGAHWVLNRENLQIFAPRANVDALQTLVDDA